MDHPKQLPTQGTAERPVASTPLSLYYALAVLVSALLLFQIQPLISRYILPWFGGTPAVWSSSMLFFQILLTGGYAYAYWLTAQPSPRKQGRIHLVLLGLSLLLLAGQVLFSGIPVAPDARWRPQNPGLPIGRIFAVLFVSVGLPYLVLSTNSTLIQSWFSRAFPGRSPYRLYALSNIGSLLGLATYPFLIEPLLMLRTQAWLWFAIYLLFALLAGYGALHSMRYQPPAVPAPASLAVQPDPVRPPQLTTRLLWLALSACASVMLLAVTAQICQEVAVIPFLWVLPLSIYLVTFILTFVGERWYPRQIFAGALFIAGGLYAWVAWASGRPGLLVEIGVYSLLLFVCCMVCHGEMVRLKPAPRYLTTFYLMVSIGGALGGILVNLVAPYVFTGLWELPLGVLGTGALLFVTRTLDRPPAQRRRSWLLSGATLAFASLVLGAGWFLYRPARISDIAVASRNFYGVLRVQVVDRGSPNQAYEMIHGATVHGLEYTSPEKSRVPTTYYAFDSGIQLTLQYHSRRPGALKIGILGLGVGTLSAYGQPGDYYRYYEINPDVARLAEGQGGYFHYLRESSASYEIVLGDARVSLGQELETGRPQHLDLLVLDVFSSGSIPTHLLTREAMDIYLQHLQPDGVIAVHISNNYLDLAPVVQKLAEYEQLGAVLIESPGNGQQAMPSRWFLLSRDLDWLARPEISDRASPVPDVSAYRLWTDDYCNLLQVLK